MKKLTEKISTKKMNYILVVIYAFSIIPMLWISMYNYPSADDFAMGVEAYRGFRDTGNIFAALGQGIYMAWYDYIHWMGYFTSTFFMSVPPSVFGETCYRAGVFIILGIFTFGMIYGMHALLVKALHIDKDLANCITMILLILTVQCMPQGLARVEAFFWYCSAANYVLMYSQGLIFLGLLISAVQDEKKGKKLYDLVMATIMGFFIGGANYMTSLSVAILCALLVLTVILCKCGKITLWKTESDAVRSAKQKWFTLLSIPAVSMLIGFICSCMAPGNNNRAAGLTGMGPVKAILTSLYYTLSYAVGEWTNWAVICFLLLMVPFLWKAVQKTTLSYRYPVLAVIFTYGMVSANICPPMYAEGNIEAGRLQALFWMQYALCMTLLEGYLLGWFYRYLNRDRKAEIHTADSHFSRASMTVIVSLAVMLLWGSALSVHVNPDFYTSTSALQDLLNGHAQEYDRQNTARREMLKDKSVTDAVLPAYTYKPDLLFFSDITTDPSDWTNEAVRRYYDKTSVVLGDEAK